MSEHSTRHRASDHSRKEDNDGVKDEGKLKDRTHRSSYRSHRHHHHHLDRDSDRKRRHDSHRNRSNDERSYSERKGKRRRSRSRSNDRSSSKSNNTNNTLQNDDTSITVEAKKVTEEKSTVSQSNSRPIWMSVDSEFSFSQFAGKKEIKRTRKEIEREQLQAKVAPRKIKLDTQQNDQKEVPKNNLDISYSFGDSGSDWRMMKLNRIYEMANENNQRIEDVAIERYGSLIEFDIAREEKQELERRKRFGDDYKGFKSKPTSELFKSRNLPKILEEPKQQIQKAISNNVSIRPLSTSELNDLKSKILKMKLQNNSKWKDLQAQYDSVTQLQINNPVTQNSNVKVISSMDSHVMDMASMKSEEEMTIQELAARQRVLDGKSQNLADGIIGNKSYSTDLDDMFENADVLAKPKDRSTKDLRNMTINKVKRVDAIIDKCPLCTENGKSPNATVVSVGTRVYLALTPTPELERLSVSIVPIIHHTNTLHCDEDEWDEIRNYMKCLARMYYKQKKGILFYENAAFPQYYRHAVITAVPVPLSLLKEAPAFFKEAIISSDDEWLQHKRIIDTGANAKKYGMNSFKISIAKEAPYFHVWFTLDGGLGHIIENPTLWPKGDQFAREVIGGLLDVEPHVYKKEGKWRRGDIERKEGFEKYWKEWDWTIVPEK